MPTSPLTDDDRRQMRELGVSESQVLRQIEAFKGPEPHMKLLRPCTLGDGIRTLSEGEMENFHSHFRAAVDEGRCIKFVPASGAATRMFKDLLKLRSLEPAPGPDEMAERAKAGEKEYASYLTFFDNIDRFAFFEDLEAAMARDEIDFPASSEPSNVPETLDYLLTPKGLNYGNLPKGLLKFHRYPEGNRTALEEHLVEAAEYVRDTRGICRIHLTISPEFHELFERLLEDIESDYEKRYGVKYEVSFSVQRPSTDTIAVDLGNRPFRLDDGKLLFRPAGHGALLENLNDLKGDIVFIKNIDNVVPDRLKGTTFKWKMALAGHLIRIQQRIFTYLQELTSGGSHALLQEAMAFAEEELSLCAQDAVTSSSPERARTFLIEELNRPLRVCGVVKNLAEPGGGPFWVKDQDGGQSRQIVESAQVDHESAEQERIWQSATHFNPVDIVCGVRDYRGNPFDLRKYVDPGAVIITRKSKDGRDLKALESPGLWNGAMARWNTLFIEVPLLTFNPVKTVFDLLRDEHQPA